VRNHAFDGRTDNAKYKYRGGGKDYQKNNFSLLTNPKALRAGLLNQSLSYD